MVKKHKRTYETAIQSIDLVQSPGHKSSGQNNYAGNSEVPEPSHQPRRNFTYSRETILRLIDWFKDK